MDNYGNSPEYESSYAQNAFDIIGQLTGKSVIREGINTLTNVTRVPYGIAKQLAMIEIGASISARALGASGSMWNPFKDPIQKEHNIFSGLETNAIRMFSPILTGDKNFGKIGGINRYGKPRIKGNSIGGSIMRYGFTKGAITGVFGEAESTFGRLMQSGVSAYIASDIGKHGGLLGITSSIMDENSFIGKIVDRSFDRVKVGKVRDYIKNAQAFVRGDATFKTPISLSHALTKLGKLDKSVTFNTALRNTLDASGNVISVERVGAKTYKSIAKALDSLSGKFGGGSDVPVTRLQSYSMQGVEGKISQIYAKVKNKVADDGSPLSIKMARELLENDMTVAGIDYGELGLMKNVKIKNRLIGKGSESVNYATSVAKQFVKGANVRKVMVNNFIKTAGTVTSVMNIAQLGLMGLTAVYNGVQGISSLANTARDTIREIRYIANNQSFGRDNLTVNQNVLTDRQRSQQAINNSQMNLRNYIGDEAQMVNSQYQ